MNHKGTLTIQTERLVLRPFVTQDAQAMFDNWAGDPEVTRFLRWPTHPGVEVSQAVTDSWVESYSRPDFYQWAIVPKTEAFGGKGGQPVGSISALELREDIDEVEIGYCIGKEWWNKGITTEALRAIITFFFEQVGSNRIEAHHAVANPHSGAVMRKSSMIYEGTSRQADRCNAGVMDMSIYAILAEDYFDNR